VAFAATGQNDLDVHPTETSNACLHAPCRKKIWMVVGREFGSDSGCGVMVVVRALCGLKSSGASWSAMLAQSLTDIGCKSTYADPDA
jgi:hypothetical protein